MSLAVNVGRYQTNSGIPFGVIAPRITLNRATGKSGITGSKNPSIISISESSGTDSKIFVSTDPIMAGFFCTSSEGSVGSRIIWEVRTPPGSEKTVTPLKLKIPWEIACPSRFNVTGGRIDIG